MGSGYGGTTKCLRPGEGDRPPEHGVQHLRGQLPGEGVLLAGMERADQPDGAHGRLRAMPEPGTWARRVPQTRQRPEGPVPREGTEGDRNPKLRKERHLLNEEGKAGVAFLGRGPVVRRSAPIDRCDVDAPEQEPIVASYRGRLVRESAPMQRGEEEVT